MKVLFASSEIHPLVKTGGLADVSASLPHALSHLGADVQVIIPAYRQVISHLSDLQSLAHIHLPSHNQPIELLHGRHPGTDTPLWLVAAPQLFDRDAGPYQDGSGNDWSDNAKRFTVYAQAVVELAQGRAVAGWSADVVHCNDWQSGLIPALLDLEPQRPATLFTIHNLAYQGLFPYQTFVDLGLPEALWDYQQLEFHGMLSFIKGGLACADRITTVSPSYAEEITGSEFGYGLEGLLSYRSDHLSGILNGIDYSLWDPQHDEHIPHHYSSNTLKDKRLNKLALQQQFRLPQIADAPLLAFIGRMVDQKGIDLILEVLPHLLRHHVQCVILGSGEGHYEQSITELANHYHNNLGVHIGYNEDLAHLIEAGSDIFLMPSRFEPCGLNQIYSLRYGTVPVVRRTGGLADTVIDVDEVRLSAIKEKQANGIVFEHATNDGLLQAIERALALYQRPRIWRQIMLNGMAQDFSWESSAAHYLRLYQQIV